MAVYECFDIITTTTIIIRAVRALEGGKGTKPCRFSWMFEFDKTEPSRFNPHHWCPLSPCWLPPRPGSLLLSSCQLGTGIPCGFSREEPAVTEEDVSETRWTFMDVGWGSWIIRSSARAKPEWVWQSAQSHAVTWDCNTLLLPWSTLRSLGESPPSVSFKNPVKALKLTVLGGAIGNRSRPPLKPQSFLWVSRLEDSSIWSWYWKMEKSLFPRCPHKTHVNLEGKGVADAQKGQHWSYSRCCAELRHHVHSLLRKPGNHVGRGSRPSWALLGSYPNSHSVASANRCLSFPHL